MKYFHENAIGAIEYRIFILYTQDDRRISLRLVIMKYFHKTDIKVIGYIISIIHNTQDDRLQWNISMKLPLESFIMELS
jgi:hypothetical protein